MAEESTKRSSIYILPNLFTTGTLFGGFYAIIASTQGKFDAAAVAIFLAMVMDTLDGRVARLTHTQSEFGMQYDSLADLVAFGLAPALVMYEWQLSGMTEWGLVSGRIGWCVAFIYVACAALRLARFNVQTDVIDKRFFNGLPSPSGAAFVVGTLVVLIDSTLSDRTLTWIALLVTALGGLLMVSNFTYYSFKNVEAIKKVPFFMMPVIILAMTTIALSPSNILYTIFLTYICSGPYLSLYRYFKKTS